MEGVRAEIVKLELGGSIIIIADVCRALTVCPHSAQHFP